MKKLGGRLAALLGLASLAIAACGDDGDTASGSGGAATASTGAVNASASGATGAPDVSASVGTADASGAVGGGGAAEGGAGQTGSGGAGETGGADGSGGAGGGGGEAAVCPHVGDPVIDPEIFPPCPGSICGGGGHCVSTALVIAQGGQEQADQLADCDEDNKCVPDLFLETGGDFIPTTCTSFAGAEGRCLSECLPAVAAQADSLPTDVCPPFERCVPCFDPFTGEEAGACSQSCDPGPTEPPVILPSCCGSIGTCLPSEILPPEQAESLPPDTCPTDANDFVCVPSVFIEDQDYVPTACLTDSIIGGGEPGACLPTCIIPALQATFLGQSTCPDDWKCAPCTDPFTGDPTGACE